MVKRYQSYKYHHAFTMIELIFAIVIIGMVMLTIPTILMSNAKHVETNLMQEAVLIATTKMEQTLSYPWDENSQDPTITPLSKTEVLRVNNGNDLLERNGTVFRIGHFQEALHRRMTSQNNIRSASTLLGSDGGDIDDIDDIPMTTITSTDENAYKQTYIVSGVSGYVSDDANYSASTIFYPYTTVTMAAGRTSNIKIIEIRVDGANTSTDPDIIFRAFSSNIGETDYYMRRY